MQQAVYLCISVHRKVNWNPQRDLTFWKCQRGERDAHLTSNVNTFIETNMHKSDENNLAVKVCMFVLKKSK